MKDEELEQEKEKTLQVEKDMADIVEQMENELVEKDEIISSIRNSIENPDAKYF